MTRLTNVAKKKTDASKEGAQVGHDIHLNAVNRELGRELPAAFGAAEQRTAAGAHQEQVAEL